MRLVGVGCVLLACAAVLLLPPQDGQLRSLVPPVQSPLFFPTLVAAVLLVAGVRLALARPPSGGAPPDGEEAESQEEQPAGMRTAMVGACLVTYGCLLNVVGYVPASVAAIFALGLALGYRNLIVLGLVALGFSFAVHTLFARTVQVLLPEGMLF